MKNCNVTKKYHAKEISLYDIITLTDKMIFQIKIWLYGRSRDYVLTKTGRNISLFGSSILSNSLLIEKIAIRFNVDMHIDRC